MHIKIAVSKLLELLFPASKVVAEIEEMSVEQFRRVAPKAPRVSDQWIHSILSYSDRRVRAAIWELKYRGNPRIAKLLAEIVYEEIVGELSDLTLFSGTTGEKPLLIPIPISRARFRERGWNQSELLAKNLADLDSGTFFTLENKSLLKIKDTPSQTKSKNRAEREKNLKGCFRVIEPNPLRGKTILLLDDVCTTGSTLIEARKTLLKSGAKAVYAITVAH